MGFRPLLLAAQGEMGLVALRYAANRTLLSGSISGVAAEVDEEDAAVTPSGAVRFRPIASPGSSGSTWSGRRRWTSRCDEVSPAAKETRNPQGHDSLERPPTRCQGKPLGRFPPSSPSRRASSHSTSRGCAWRTSIHKKPPAS